jgi:hypothetical protein
VYFGRKISKIKQIRASEQSIGCPGARCFVFRGKNIPKKPVYFLRFLALQRTPKRVEGEGFEPRPEQDVTISTCENDTGLPSFVFFHFPLKIFLF